MSNFNVGDTVYITPEFFNKYKKYETDLSGKPLRIVGIIKDNFKLELKDGRLKDRLGFLMKKEFITKSKQNEQNEQITDTRSIQTTRLNNGITCYEIYRKHANIPSRYISHAKLKEVLYNVNGKPARLTDNINIITSSGETEEIKNALEVLLMDYNMNELIWNASLNDTTCTVTQERKPKFNRWTGLPITNGGRKNKSSKKKVSKKNPKKSPKIHTGPRGGKYIIKKGKKIYQ